MDCPEIRNRNQVKLRGRGVSRPLILSGGLIYRPERRISFMGSFGRPSGSLRMSRRERKKLPDGSVKLPKPNHLPIKFLPPPRASTKQLYTSSSAAKPRTSPRRGPTRSSSWIAWPGFPTLTRKLWRRLGPYCFGKTHFFISIEFFPARRRESRRLCVKTLAIRRRGSAGPSNLLWREPRGTPGEAPLVLPKPERLSAGED